MFKRKAWQAFENWYQVKDKHALLVDGARQVGKTYLIHKFLEEKFENVVEINLFNTAGAAEALSGATTSRDLFMRITAFAEQPLIPGKTAIFLDEIQMASNVVTLVKFLKEREGFDYVLSGSLLGTCLKNVTSMPVGYLIKHTMYPMDFEEYCWACNVAPELLDEAHEAFEQRRPVDPYVHARLIKTMHNYLISGGMPDAVQTFVDTNNIPLVRTVQSSIIELHQYDISKYAPLSRVASIKRIFDLIPSQISRENKRFKVSEIEGDSHTARYRDDFLWLLDAGVALEVCNLTEPRYPLKVYVKENAFKLFGSDVGLLTYQMGMDAVREMLAGRTDVNFGALYENFVAQELVAHGMQPHYFSNRKLGEIDFVVQHPQAYALPIEVKSGASFTQHAALDKALQVENWGLNQALVLCESNVQTAGDVLYAPVYMVAFLQNRRR